MGAARHSTTQHSTEHGTAWHSTAQRSAAQQAAAAAAAAAVAVVAAAAAAPDLCSVPAVCPQRGARERGPDRFQYCFAVCLQCSRSMFPQRAGGSSAQSGPSFGCAVVAFALFWPAFFPESRFVILGAPENTKTQFLFIAKSLFRGPREIAWKSARDTDSTAGTQGGPRGRQGTPGEASRGPKGGKGGTQRVTTIFGTTVPILAPRAPWGMWGVSSRRSGLITYQ